MACLELGDRLTELALSAPNHCRAESGLRAQRRPACFARSSYWRPRSTFPCSRSRRMILKVGQGSVGVDVDRSAKMSDRFVDLDRARPAGRRDCVWATPELGSIRRPGGNPRSPRRSGQAEPGPAPSWHRIGTLSGCSSLERRNWSAAAARFPCLASSRPGSSGLSRNSDPGRMPARNVSRPRQCRPRRAAISPKSLAAIAGIQ